MVVYKHVDIPTFAQVSVYRFARPEDRPTKFTTPTHTGFLYRYDDVIEYVLTHQIELKIGVDDR